MNMKHRTESEQQEGTLKCSECNEQFTSNWNLRNHQRDNHPKTQDCKHFKEGICKFPGEECWDKHTRDVSNEISKDIGYCIL